jgi:GntR family transcriptional regulator / MocR family aminotransferase
VRQANDLSPSHLYQAALADFMSGGHFTRHIRKTRQLYMERRNALAQALRNEFGSEIEILGAEAGMHLVITLPPGLSDQKISASAARENLWLWPLSAAYAGKDVRQGFILGFGSTKADEMIHKVRRLRKAIRDGSGHGERRQSGN